MEIGYTVKTTKSVDDAVKAVEAATAEYNFRVLYIHNVDETLKEKGFEREPYKIIEICNAKFASQVLETDINIGLFLPCKINVYTHGESTFISGLRPVIMSEIFNNGGIDEIASEVDGIIRKIIDAAK